jgi:hypothetical protein
MTTYEVELPDGPERGLRIVCPDHDAATELQPGERGGTLYCPDCGYELEVRLHDTFDWRDWGEHC